jgi:hypothetical protein
MVAPMTDDPNSAYAILPAEPDGSLIPATWWRVTRNGEPWRTCPTRESAERYATDPAYRAEIAAAETPLHLRGKR